MGKIYEKMLEYENKYPDTLGFRLKKHAQVIEDNLLEGEKVLHVYYGSIELFRTMAIVVTDKRIIFGRKNLAFGSFCISIDKDKICEVSYDKGLMFGKVKIVSLNGRSIEICYLDQKSTSVMKEEITDNTIVKSINERQNSKTVSSKPKKQYVSDLERQKEMCRELDTLYRKQLKEAKSQVEKEEINIKLWNNYYYYLNLIGANDEQIRTPQTLTLKRD